MPHIEYPGKQGFPKRQLKRECPSMKGFGRNGRGRELQAFLARYEKFLARALVPPLVVEEVLEMAKRKGYKHHKETSQPNAPFYVLGPDGHSFALVKPGRKPTAKSKDRLDKGVKIVAAHVDSPSLILRAMPTRLEWCPDNGPLFPGAMLKTVPSGGIIPGQWSSLDGILIGSIWRGNQHSLRRFEAAVLGRAAHLDQRGEGTPEQHNDPEFNYVFLGDESENKLIEHMGYATRKRRRGIESFWSDRWWVVPSGTPTRLGDDKEWFWSYGQDDSCCVFPSVDALLRMGRTENTCVVLGLNHEEIGCRGAGGSVGKFPDYVLRLVKKRLGSNLEMDDIWARSQCLSADCDAAPGPIEVDMDKDGFNLENAPKVGYGMLLFHSDGLSDGSNVSGRYRDHVVRMMEDAKVKGHVVDTPVPAMLAEGMHTLGIDFANRGTPTVDLGLPVMCTHGVRELAHGADVYWAGKAYEAFLKHPAKFEDMR